MEKFAEDLLINGRPEFDVPHTHGVVAWIYVLAKAYSEADSTQEPVDAMVLVTAAWLHDIGYYGQFEGIADHDKVHDKKAMHMVVGALMAKEFLSTHASHILSPEQIEHIVHLIRVHDDLYNITTISETILVEADTLGMMDVDWVKPTYKGEQALNFPNMDKTKKRFSVFKTPLGEEVLPEIVKKFQQFVIDRNFGGEDPRS